MTVLEQIQNINPEAIKFDGLDDAVIGFGNHCGKDAVLIYSYRGIVTELIRQMNCNRDDADDWFNCNIENVYLGPHMPIILYN